MVLERAASSFLVVLAISGCASAGGGPARPRTDRVGPAFADVQKVAVFREKGAEKKAPGKDLMDGVADSLARRGWTVVQEPPTPEGAKALAALHDRLDPWKGPALDARRGVVFGIAEGAGDLVRQAGLDAVAFTYRFVRVQPMDSVQAQNPWAAPRTDVRNQVTGAIVLVSARDEVARVDWGRLERADLSTAPENAAEAIDALMMALDAEKEPPAGEGPAPVIRAPGAPGSAP